MGMGLMDLVMEQWAFLQDVAQLIQYAAAKGYTLSGGELWRTPEQEALDVKAGRSHTMNSNHLRRLAIDLNFFNDAGQLVSNPQDMGTFWESLNPFNRWGGNFTTLRDYPHFERNVP